jgi:hypothetical protein
MKGHGTIGFGGAGVVGGVGANITLADGSNWTFVGTVLGLTVGGGASTEVSGDFPGADHMSGLCTVSVCGAAVGVGNLEMRWGDTHGEIGTVTGKAFGGEISAGGGTGWWTKN